MKKVMETIKVILPNAEYIYDNPLIIEYIRKVVKGKATIHLEMTDYKRFFDIECYDKNTIYINEYKTEVCRYDRSNRLDYMSTTNFVGVMIDGICEGYGYIYKDV